MPKQNKITLNRQAVSVVLRRLDLNDDFQARVASTLRDPQCGTTCRHIPAIKRAINYFDNIADNKGREQKAEDRKAWQEKAKDPVKGEAAIARTHKPP